MGGFSQKVLQAIAQAERDFSQQEEVRRGRATEKRAGEEHTARLAQLQQATQQGAELFPLKKKAAEQDVEQGVESLNHLRLQNEQLAQQNKLFDSPESLDSLVQQSIKDLGDLKPEEKAEIEAAKVEARQSRKFSPIGDAVSRIANRRGIAARQEDSQSEIYKRFLENQQRLIDSQGNKDTQRQTSNEDRLRTRYEQHPTIKEYRSANIFKGRLNSGASDLALIFSYMKMLDPISVVREGEFATAQNSGNIPERIRATYNRLIEGKGQRLDDAQRKRFIEDGNKLFKAIQEQKRKVDAFYKTTAGKRGLDAANVIDPDEDEDIPEYDDNGNPIKKP